MPTTPEAFALADAFRNSIGITGADKVAAALTSLAAERDQLRAEVQNSHEAWVALSDHAEKLRAELAALRRGEFICQKCGLRKDADAGPVPF